eukprot:CAMPEP_0174887114 /NCGR_PEP_ID=MMETSP0167-20121228/2341_1 /TAXON_ID=38298 /ORGANISM="Rhodella maculata, Strain CCMP736" /LENGTH=39 /DNA_ID= /DNA_START= /DNA_END= /DNA_ORIENTATION=
MSPLPPQDSCSSTSSSSGPSISRPASAPPSMVAVLRSEV